MATDFLKHTENPVSADKGTRSVFVIIPRMPEFQVLSAMCIAQYIQPLAEF